MIHENKNNCKKTIQTKHKNYIIKISIAVLRCVAHANSYRLSLQQHVERQ